MKYSANNIINTLFQFCVGNSTKSKGGSKRLYTASMYGCYIHNKTEKPFNIIVTGITA